MKSSMILPVLALSITASVPGQKKLKVNKKTLMSGKTLFHILMELISLRRFNFSEI